MKHYRYKIYFGTHEAEIVSISTPENMNHDFHSQEIVRMEYGGKIYFIDFSKVCLIVCSEIVNFADMDKE